MRDYKYHALVIGEAKWEGLVKTPPRSDSLRGIADAFTSNLERAATFAFTPAQISYMARSEQMFTDVSIFKVTGKVDQASSFEDQDCLQQIHKQIKIESKKFYSHSKEELEESLLKFGVGYIEVILERNKGLQKAMDAILSSLVIEYWTIFESLASDLWVAAVDNGPKQIRVRVSASNKLLKPDDNIGAKELLEVSDPQEHYGSMLRDLGRVSFQKLDYIKRFYSVAFDHDFNKLFSDTEGGYILALSAFRNALIHNAGKADKHFERQVAGFPALRGIKRNDSLPIDGELVKKLRDVSVLLGIELIQFVDNILTPSNPWNVGNCREPKNQCQSNTA